MIGNGVTSIGNNAFQSCGDLKTVTIGSGVTAIGNSAFAGCKLKECYCYATTPPKLSYRNPFEGIISGATLYVPARCGTEYKKSDWGDSFKNIVEMD